MSSAVVLHKKYASLGELYLPYHSRFGSAVRWRENVDSVAVAMSVGGKGTTILARGNLRNRSTQPPALTYYNAGKPS